MPTVEEKRAQLRERNIQGTLLRCRHFTGIQQDECLAGVSYANFMDAGSSLPCIPLGKPAAVTCDKKSCWTREEAEANQADVERRQKAFLNAASAAHIHAAELGFGEGHGGQGELPCPVCQTGLLRYIVAAFNGHMHAACNTKDCISWME